MSYGMCQFPTLGFVVERYKQTLGFESEPYWTIVIKLPNEASTETNEEVPENPESADSENSDEPKAETEAQQKFLEFKWSRKRIFDHHTVLTFFESLLTSEDKCEIVAMTQTHRTKKKPQPLNTIRLQKLASRKLHMTSAIVMETAEKLYNRGLISYPRTETDQYSRDFDFEAVISELEKSKKYG